MYRAPLPRSDSRALAVHVPPPSVVRAYRVFQLPSPPQSQHAAFRLSCHAKRKSPAVGPATIAGKLLSPWSLMRTGSLQETPSDEDRMNIRCAVPLTSFRVYRTSSLPEASAAPAA